MSLIVGARILGVFDLDRLVLLLENPFPTFFVNLLLTRKKMFTTILFTTFMRMIYVSIGAFIMAFILIKATKLAVKVEIPYWDAYKISLVLGVINVLVILSFQLFQLGARVSLGCFSHLLLIPIHFFIGAAIYGGLIEEVPNSKESIGFSQGLLIQLYVMAIAAVIGVVIGIFFVLGSAMLTSFF